MSQESKNVRIQYTEGIIAIIGNLVLFVLKLWAGLVSNSAAIIADAWHTLSDSFSSVMVLVAARISKLPADKKRPFGYGRASIIAGFFIGTLIAVIGYEFFKEGIERFKTRETATYGLLAIVITIVSVLIKEAMAQYAFWGYRKTKDTSLRADAWHHRSDAFSSVVVLIGILLGGKYWWMDGVLSILIAVLLVYAAYSIVSESISLILGEQPNSEEIKEIEDICNKELHRPSGLHHVHIHRYGDHAEVTFHIIFSVETTVQQAHAVIKKIEHQLRSQLNMEATIRIDIEKKPLKD